MLIISQDKNGKWSRSGEFFTAVEQGSSMLQLPNKIEETLAVEGDHSDMVKFDHNSGLAYTTILKHLREFKPVVDPATQLGENSQSSVRCQVADKKVKKELK